MELVDRPPPQPPYTLLGLLLSGQTDTLLPSRSPGRGFTAGIDASLFLSIYLERASVVLQWVALVLVTIFLLRRLSEVLRLWKAAKSIPGPPWGSFFGLRRVCPKAGDANDYLSKMHQRYGSIVKIWLTPTELLVSFKDPLAIIDVLLKVKDKFPQFGRALRLAFGMCSLFSPSYEAVKTRRELLELNLNKIVMGKSKTISFEVLKRTLKADHPVLFEQFLDCYSICQRFAFHFLGATVFGSSFFLWQNAAIYEELFIAVAQDANLLAAEKVPPFWRLRFWRHYWLCYKLKCLSLELIQYCTGNDGFSGQICQVHTEETAVFCQDDAATDELRFEGIYGCLVSEEEPCGNIIGVMLHGFLRIACLIYHLLSRLVSQPELQEQIYAEMKEFHGRASGPNWYDVQSMQLLMSTVHEYIQLLPAGLLLQRCSMKQDITLWSGVNVPQGALLVIPAVLVRKDHSIWCNDACQFSPQHFISEAGGNDISDAEVKESTNSETIPSFREISLEGTKHERHLLLKGGENKTRAFFPFGLGARACVGQNLVIHGVSTLLAHLLLHYQLRLPLELPSHIKKETSGPKGQRVPKQIIALLKRNPRRWS